MWNADLALAGQHGGILTQDNVLFSNDAFRHLAHRELFNDEIDQCDLFSEALNITRIFATVQPISPKKTERNPRVESSN